ncbi:hypothetical protein V9T40_014871 [Parthenolecanium corni]|uniref:Translocon-associated protein subunit delta n=1 Tax=Parthenolecanium corni TaxID=536013 RepID=A0AAN9TXF1_9HEMI
MWSFVVSLTILQLPLLFAAQCTNPEITSLSYTTQDGMVVSEVAFISEFTLECANKASGLTLYGEIDGKILPVMKVDDRVHNKYQVSWTEEIKKAHSGDYVIGLYDEEGFSNLKKAIRGGEDPKSVAPLTTITVNYSGAYLGPWINCEFLAAVSLIGAWYVAFVHKSKLLS